MKKAKDTVLKVFNKIIWCIRHITYRMVLMVLCVVLALIAFSMFQTNINYKINQNTESYLTSILNEGLDRVSLKIDEEIAILQTIAVSIQEKDENTVRNHMLNQIELHGFFGIHVVNISGDVQYTYGNSFSGVSKEYITGCNKKGYYISDVMINQGNNKEYLDLAVPVNNEMYLVCSYDLKEFTDIIESSHFEQMGTIFISQEDGTLIARPESVGENRNLFELLDSINTYNEKTILKLKNSIHNKESGTITYGTGEHKRYISYKVIPETSWYAVAFISSSAIEPLAKSVSKLANVLAIEIIAIFISYMAIVISVKIYRKQFNLFS
jgi:hypothetical protein